MIISSHSSYHLQHADERRFPLVLNSIEGRLGVEALKFAEADGECWCKVR